MATQKTKAELEAEVEVKEAELKKLKSKEEQKNKEIEEFNSKIAKLEEMVNNLVNSSTEVAKSDKTEEKISLDEDIPVMNLTAGQVNIATDGAGQGDITTFETHKEIIDIPFSDLKLYVKNNKRFFSEGLLYILDERAVKQFRLSSAYKKILTDEVLDKLLEEPHNKIVETYKMATKGQQDIIISKISAKKLNHEEVDANVLLELGELSGKNLIDLENPNDIPLDGDK